MPLRDVFPLDEVTQRIGEPVVVSEHDLAAIDAICEIKREGMVDIGSSIGYRAKVLDEALDLEQFANAFNDHDPKLFEYIGHHLHQPALHDVFYANVELADQSAKYRTVAELLIAVAYPNVMHIGDVEFSNPRKPISKRKRTRAFTHYKGLGLLGLLIDNCVAYAGENGLDAICLTPAGHDLVPLFESLGFVRDDNDLAELMRQAGSAGPMHRQIPRVGR